MKPFEIPEKYLPFHCDHLLLLVGANPLPNYVAARLLLHPENGHLHLFASKETGVSNVSKSETNNVATQIQKQFPQIKSRIIGLSDVSDARGIRNQLLEYLEDKKLKNEILAGSRIGLNYTSGTKPMSVHMHETLQEWCNKQNLIYQHSYLDPRQIAFRFANGTKLSIKPTDCPLSLETLVDLHGWKITASHNKVDLPELSSQLAQKLGADIQTFKEWRQWCDWHLRTWSGLNQWRRFDWPGFKESGLSPLLASWVEQAPDHINELEALLQWVQTNNLRSKKSELAEIRPYPILSEQATLADLLAELRPQTDWPDNNSGFGQLSAYLDGFWLENYVLGCIQKISESSLITESFRGVEIKRSGKYTAGFELDVAAMKGYQLFAISCTTSLIREQNKKRLFEVYARARQMGGDEARVALVGGYEQTDGLLQEVNEEWLVPQDMIRVFGPQDWPDLAEKLKRWFNWEPT